ncbi:fumarylacetoacetate hydrolase family protein [Elioraea tepidiphila]|uniref:fumarylacetoacetate hydrolase family protein n=1 Tax=Elioraea tepidiphila TaxID=457934 RepID=UPI0003745D62|nr:fumarylacetoacetate hydrolase family protein [Elioraea tepidiphila]
MAYAIDPPPVPAIPVAGTDTLFPVRRIWCVGRNYAEHAREMGHDPNREPPFFFAKPADAIVLSGATIPFPPATEDLHHEIELVVAIGKAGMAIDEAAALDHVFGYAVGLDMTRRDRQAEAKKLQRPWEIGKAFDQSCPITPIVPASRIGHPAKGSIWLKVNGAIRQQGDLAQQIWSVPETIAYLSRLVALAPGDLIMTGTPAGVGAVKPGDRLEGHVDGVGDLTIAYAAEGARAAA